jgi:hypothetical protein
MQITFDRPGDPFQDRRLNHAQVVTPGQGDAEKSARPRRQCGDLLKPLPFERAATGADVGSGAQLQG